MTKYDDLDGHDRTYYDMRLGIASVAARNYSKFLQGNEPPEWEDSIMSMLGSSIQRIAEEALLVNADYDIDPWDFISDVETLMQAKFGDVYWTRQPCIDKNGVLKDVSIAMPLNLDHARELVTKFYRKNHPSQGGE